ncbi:MAG: hypothetical protein RSD95_03740 [Clostridia bacterium]
MVIIENTVDDPDGIVKEITVSITLTTCAYVDNNEDSSIEDSVRRSLEDEYGQKFSDRIKDIEILELGTSAEGLS